MFSPRHLLVAILVLLSLLATDAHGQFDKRKKEREKREGKGERELSYEEKWTLDPANEDPEWRQAHEYYKYGHYDETLRLFKKFLAKSPNEVSVACSMAGIYWDRGQYDLAEQWYDKALVMVPRHVEARKFKARMLYQMGRWKESAAVFEELIGIPGLRGDILGSAHLNLGKIALLQRKFRHASRWFDKAARSPRKGHRTQAEKGRMMVIRFKRTRMWNNEKTQGLDLYFSPTVQPAKDASRRKAWAAKCQLVFDRICKTLGMSFRERIPVYVFTDDGDSYEITNQDLPTWKYSWWVVATGWDRQIGYDLALQIVARVRGFRPGSKPMVCGLAAYAAGLPDPHAEARKLLAAGKLKSFSEVHVRQRYPLEEGLLYGQSFVAWLIDTYGMEPFLKSFAEYKMVLLDPHWKSAATGAMNWPGIMSEVFRRGIGKDLPTLEKAYRAFLAR